MAKIIKLEQKTYQGKPQGFKVTLDDGTSGNLQEKESDKGLREGDDVIVTLIPYTSKAGVTSNLIGLRLARPINSTAPPAPQSPQPQQQQSKPFTVPPTTGVRDAKSITEMRFEGRVVCLKLAVECVLQGKADFPDVKTYFNEWVAVMDTAIDELKPGR